MKKLALVAIAAAALLGPAGGASAQTFYFGVGPQYREPPPPPPPRYYRERDRDERGYRRSERERYGYDDRPRYHAQQPQRGGYAPPSPQWRTWNGCPPNFTVQDGVCKPYRGR
jgi:hypothetical protein